MTFTWQELIDRARTHVDDDHSEDEGWITAARWLTYANVEYAKLYKQWVRTGLISPISEVRLTSSVSSHTGVLAVVGVGEDKGNRVRVLTPAQLRDGRDPFWRGSTEATGTAVRWKVTGAGDTVTVELSPRDPAANLTPEVIAATATLTLASGFTVAALTAGSAANGRVVSLVNLPSANPSLTVDTAAAVTARFDATGGDFHIDSTWDQLFAVLNTSAFIEVTNQGGLTGTMSAGAEESGVLAGGVDHVAAIDGSYIMRYVPTVAYATSSTATIDLPYGADERLVLGMARRAMIKESGASRRIDADILDFDAELNLSAFGRLGPKVRRAPPASPNMLLNWFDWTPDPSTWLFLR